MIEFVAQIPHLSAWVVATFFFGVSAYLSWDRYFRRVEEPEPWVGMIFAIFFVLAAIYLETP